MNDMKNIFIKVCCVMILGNIFIIPLATVAQELEPGKKNYQIIIPCEGEGVSNGAQGTVSEKMCGFKDFMNLVDRFIKLLLYVAVLLAVISFIYAGFRLLFSGGNEEAVKHAKHIFWNVVVGLVLVYGAWLIIHFIVVTLGVNEGYDLLR